MSSYFDTTKPESQLTEADDSQDVDSQLTVAKGPSRSAPPAISTVLSLPPGLFSLRQQAFHLNAQLVWTAEEFDQYWPFVDNIWVHNHTEPMTKKKTRKFYWYCRLWKNDADKKTEGQGRRAKRMRITPPCPMKLAMIKHFDESDNLLTVTLNCHVSKKNDAVNEHNHTLEYLDTIKINSAIKLSAGQEVAKGYTPAVVNRNMQGVKYGGNLEALKIAGGLHFDLKAVHNAGKGFKKLNPDIRILGAKEVWETQFDDCFDALQASGEDVLSAKLKVARAVDGEFSHAIAFTKRSRLRTLMKRGHLTLMDSTHHTNHLKWKLFTLMIRDECGSWIPGGHMLASNEDGDIIAEFLRQIKQWCKGCWRLRYIITDDSAAEQRGVSLAFLGLIAGEMKISHFLCRTHSERTLNRKLTDAACKNAKKHLYDALYFRKTEMGCDDSIKKAMKSAPACKRDYIEREWAQTKPQWANYSRQHSCILLQCMTTNAVESWHASIKKHADGKHILTVLQLSY